MLFGVQILPISAPFKTAHFLCCLRWTDWLLRPHRTYSPWSNCLSERLHFRRDRHEKYKMLITMNATAFLPKLRKLFLASNQERLPFQLFKRKHCNHRNRFFHCHSPRCYQIVPSAVSIGCLTSPPDVDSALTGCDRLSIVWGGAATSYEIAPYWLFHWRHRLRKWRTII